MDILLDLVRFFGFLMFMAGVWGLLFLEPENFLEDYFENSFIKSWSIIFIIITILSYLGGQQDRINVEYDSGFFGGLGYQIGSALGVIIFSLVLTYLYILIKIPLKKIHQITNKKAMNKLIPLILLTALVGCSKYSSYDDCYEHWMSKMPKDLELIIHERDSYISAVKGLCEEYKD